MNCIPELLSPRHQLLDQLDQRIAACRSGGERMALLVVNLCGFRAVNIRFGHEVGDRVLEEAARRIAAVLRPGDVLLHIGNDEFAIILSQLKGSQIALLASEKVLSVLNGNYEFADEVLGISARLGCAVFPEHASNRDELMRAADSALHFARKHQRDYVIYDASTRSRDAEAAKLKGNLRDAIDNDEIMLYYQPQLDLQRGMVSGCEALSRWKHAQDGWISPEIFIAAAEQNGFIDELTYRSINIALRKWFEFYAACPSATIAVNLSAKLLHSPELAAMVERSLNIWGASPASVVLEVTESAMMSDPKIALRTLSALNEMGIRLSIDDFGTGYSSLAYLKRLPVGELKIDKSFVMQMAENTQDRKIVQSVIDLAHTLDMHVVAEGIESRQVLDMLVGMGCDYGQGYFIARPMPDNELAKWLGSCAWTSPETESG